MDPLIRQAFANSIQNHPLIKDAILIACCDDKEEGTCSCECCGAPKANKRCKACHCVAYCSKECQVADWYEGGHDKECVAIRENHKWSQYQDQLTDVNGPFVENNIMIRHMARFLTGDSVKSATEYNGDLPWEVSDAFSSEVNLIDLAKVGANTKFLYSAKKKKVVSKNERAAADFATMMSRRAYLLVAYVKAIMRGKKHETNKLKHSLKLNSTIVTARFNVPPPSLKKVWAIMDRSTKLINKVVKTGDAGARKELLQKIPQEWSKYWIEWSIKKDSKEEKAYAQDMENFLNRILVLPSLFVDIKDESKKADKDKVHKKKTEIFYQAALDAIALAEKAGKHLDDGVRPGQIVKLGEPQFSDDAPIACHHRDEATGEIVHGRRHRHRHMRRKYIVAATQKQQEGEKETDQ